jgi:hypothetical protein
MIKKALKGERRLRHLTWRAAADRRMLIAGWLQAVSG